MKSFFKLIFLSNLLLQVIAPTLLFAQDFVVIPKAESSAEELGAKVDQIGNSQDTGTVWDRYNTTAQELDGRIGDQISSGIMTWDTLINIAAYAVEKMSQLGLVIGALMIIYAGYQYAMSSFDGGDPSKGQAAIKNALYGILVIIFSYALIRIVARAFLY